MIIGLVARMGANLSAMQWATVLLAIKQVGPTLSPYVQRAIAYVVSLASSKIAKTIMEMSKITDFDALPGATAEVSGRGCGVVFT